MRPRVAVGSGCLAGAAKHGAGRERLDLGTVGQARAIRLVMLLGGAVLGGATEGGAAAGRGGATGLAAAFAVQSRLTEESHIGHQGQAAIGVGSLNSEATQNHNRRGGKKKSLHVASLPNYISATRARG